MFIHLIIMYLECTKSKFEEIKLIKNINLSWLRIIKSLYHCICKFLWTQIHQAGARLVVTELMG